MINVSLRGYIRLNNIIYITFSICLPFFNKYISDFHGPYWTKSAKKSQFQCYMVLHNELSPWLKLTRNMIHVASCPATASKHGCWHSVIHNRIFISFTWHPVFDRRRLFACSFNSCWYFLFAKHKSYSFNFAFSSNIISKMFNRIFWVIVSVITATILISKVVEEYEDTKLLTHLFVMFTVMAIVRPFQNDRRRRRNRRHWINIIAKLIFHVIFLEFGHRLTFKAKNCSKYKAWEALKFVFYTFTVHQFSYKILWKPDTWTRGR